MTASRVARSSSNFEMSAPETKAFPPAPVSTTTRTSSSAAKSVRMRAAASHMSSETALWRAGLSKITVPTRPSLRDVILPAGWLCSTGSSLLAVSYVLDHLRLLQRLDLRLRESHLAQHLGGMLAPARRRRGEPARSAPQGHRLPDDAQRLLFLHDAEMRDLRVGEHLIDPVDRTARNAGGVQRLDPLRARAVREVPFQRGVQGIAVLRARRRRRIGRIAQQRLRPDGMAQALPHGSAHRCDVEVAVAGLEHAGRDAGRMVVPGLLGDLPGVEPARGLEVEHEDLRLQ